MLQFTIGAFVLIALVILSYFIALDLDQFYDFNIMQKFTNFVNYLDTIHKEYPKAFIVFIFVFQFIDTIFILPFYTISNIIFAYLLKEFWVSTIVLFLVPFTITILMYFVICNRVLKFMKEKLQNYQAYQVLMHNTDTNTFFLCMIIRFLYIPLGSKEYIILALNYPFVSMVSSSMIYFFLHSLVFALVGSHLTSISDALK